MSPFPLKALLTLPHHSPSASPTKTPDSFKPPPLHFSLPIFTYLVVLRFTVHIIEKDGIGRNDNYSLVTRKTFPTHS